MPEHLNRAQKSKVLRNPGEPEVQSTTTAVVDTRLGSFAAFAAFAAFARGGAKNTKIKNTPGWGRGGDDT